jgi:DNA adenine methylase
MTPTRPIVRYHGGKWTLAPWIISQFPAHRVYIESFGGGGSVLLRKPRAYAEIYNDLDDEIVNVFEMMRDHGDELTRLVQFTPFSRTEFQRSYQSTRNPLERARRTIIRSYMGFGSDGITSHVMTGFRGSSQRSGTTPAHDWRNLPDCMAATIDRLRGVVIENRDAFKVIQKYDETNALHYVDPPYVHSTRKRSRAGRGYRHEMTDAQHEQLAEMLHSVKGAVIVSGYPSALYEKLFKGWERIERTGPFADGADERTEVLWLRNVQHDLFRTP